MLARLLAYDVAAGDASQRRYGFGSDAGGAIANPYEVSRQAHDMRDQHSEAAPREEGDDDEGADEVEVAVTFAVSLPPSTVAGGRRWAAVQIPPILSQSLSPLL